jgi:hypothetical protein
MSPELTALVVIVTLILQTWYQRWVTKGDKKEVVQKVETVHKAVNGEGIGGKLDRLLRWQADHEQLDTERFRELNERMDGMGAPPAKAK